MQIAQRLGRFKGQDEVGSSGGDQGGKLPFSDADVAGHAAAALAMPMVSDVRAS